MSLIEQIKANIDLKALTEDAGAEFTNGRSRCPLHGGDNKSAFSIFNNGQSWHCFTTCGAGGDVIEFYRRWKQTDTKTAVRELAQRANIKRESPQRPFKPNARQIGNDYRKRLKSFVEWTEGNLWGDQGQPIRGYLHQHRGWTDDALRVWRIGYNPSCMWRPAELWGTPKKVYLSAGIVHPHLDSRSEPFWCNIRRPRPKKSPVVSEIPPITPVSTLTEIKWMGLPNAPRKMIGKHTHQKHDTLILVEGEPDLITAWQEVKDVADVATLGGATGALSREDALYIASYSRVLAIYDPDPAGQKGLSKLTGQMSRIQALKPPLADGDITDFCMMGGCLRCYLSGLIDGNCTKG